MFCSGCGLEILIEAKFCHGCGLAMHCSSSEESFFSDSGTSTTPKRPLASGAVSFEEFRERKQKERRSWFKKKRVTEKSEKKASEVTMQIGQMKFCDGKLKVVRGATLPLKVYPFFSSEQLLKKGVEKMTKFNQDLMSARKGFTLVYPDQTEVKFLPGSTEEFTLQRYKEELGKAYGRITLYLCTTSDFLDCTLQEAFTFSEGSDDSLAYEEVCKSALQS